jgi:hypothetical protein
MNLKSLIYQALRISRDVNAVRRGPKAVAKRAARKTAYKAFAKAIDRMLG